MKIKTAEFIISAVRKKDYPKDGLPEVVLIGRSNVGKSSLINTLVNRKGLAKTSSSPGKTRTINFYRINGEFFFVDLPGFGYAKVPQSVRLSWEKMIEEYLEGRAEVRCAVIVLDARRTPGDAETRLYRWLEGSGVPVITVITKTDKLSGNKLTKSLRDIKKALGIKDPVAFSAVKGHGKHILLKRLGEALGAG
ncbi:MAG: ribosome biogenesis GTP-binding protein YihA/YsxC [Thermodesulfobacteriota bacterium]|nr:MAG: ribosome biogenesis GTP-binding protein YihA/YsxC [Thermodesulfobacteriota bacterium]